MALCSDGAAFALIISNATANPVILCLGKETEPREKLNSLRACSLDAQGLESALTTKPTGTFTPQAEALVGSTRCSEDPGGTGSASPSESRRSACGLPVG